MNRLFRAAAFAAASFVAVFGVDAGPSLAWEPLPAPLTEISTVMTVQAPAVPVPSVEPPPPPSLTELVSQYADVRTDDAQHDCLAGAVYFEAKGESLEGQLTVAEVILNRVRSGRFASTVCGVVKQRGQFSFVRGGRIPVIARSSAAWRRAVAIAKIARDGLAEGAAPKALFFHARYVAPRWKLTRVAAVGKHIFYR